MLDSLITESLVQGDSSWLASFPRDLLDKDEKKAIDYILKYKSHHGTLPSPKRMQQTPFKGYVSKASLMNAPLPDVFEQALAWKRRLVFASALREWELEVDDGAEIPYGKIQKFLKMINATGIKGVESLSTMDRTGMYAPLVAGSSLTFGFSSIDGVTGGIQAGEFAVLAARIGSGKTTILCWMAKLWAFTGKRVLLLSNEMPPEQIIGRMDAMIAGFNPVLLRNRSDPAKMLMLKQKVENIIQETLNPIGGEVIIPKKRCGTPLEMMSMAEEYGVDVIAVDGMYLMNPSSGRGGVRWERIAGVTNEIKQVSLDTKLPIIGTTQLKRQGNDLQINLESLAYSDAIGQDADFVIALQPDVVGNNKNFTISMVKNRHGAGYNVNSSGAIDYDTMNIKEVEEF